jgi:dihydrofolate synthase/folylpolyglutamate synthase
VSKNLTLNEWLELFKTVHVTDMDLSLERVSEVAKKLNLKPNCPIIAVGGTNGKGSCVAGLESIYMAAGKKVGTFNSPVLFRHNEYVRIQGKEASDEDFCSAFARIEAVRGKITLTPFEYNALAAFEIFQKSNLDVWILEVGLGGRFDAVNIMDADIAMVTSVGIDHTDWLGETREKIGFEKAGIFRKDKPAICGDFDPPLSLVNYAKEIDAPFYSQNQQFGFDIQATHWSWWSEKQKLEHLPIPQLALQNMATVLMAIELLQKKLPVTLESIQKGLSSIHLPGRIQVIPGKVTQIFDVAHNPHAAEFLASWLNKHPIAGKTHAVFSMLADKDIVGTLWVMKEEVDNWFIASLEGPRAASLPMLESCFRKACIPGYTPHNSIMDAYKAATTFSAVGDRIIVFGSFHTVAFAYNKN